MSILVAIEEKNSELNIPFCICLIYEPIEGNQGRLDVLKEINISTEDNDWSGNDNSIQSSFVCKFHSRKTYKFNSKKIDYYGEGRYAILLVQGTKEQIDADVHYAFEHQVSNVCFEVIPEKGSK